MLDNINAASVQLLTLLSFAVSVVAAVLAIDMYRLLRTGEVGNAWRVLIVASVLFAFTLALRFAENFHWSGLDRLRLSRIGELLFVFALASSFYMQRRAFSHQAKVASEEEKPVVPPRNQIPDRARENEDSDDLGRYYAEGGARRS
jgi:hypothetical protein